MVSLLARLLAMIVASEEAGTKGAVFLLSVVFAFYP